MFLYALILFYFYRVSYCVCLIVYPIIDGPITPYLIGSDQRFEPPYYG